MIELAFVTAATLLLTFALPCLAARIDRSASQHSLRHLADQA